MIFALEGPDGCGKSTLYKALEQHPKWQSKIVHFVKWGPLKDLWQHIVQLEERDHALFTSMYDSRQVYVCDRFCAITGPVYARVYNRPTFGYYTGPWEPDGLVVCYLRVAPHVQMTRLARRGDLAPIISRQREIHAEYERQLIGDSRFKQVEILDGTQPVETLIEQMSSLFLKHALLTVQRALDG